MTGRPTESQPVLEQSKIQEEELAERRISPQPRPRTKEARLPAPSPREEAQTLPDDSSLLAKINQRTPPQRAASLRLTEEGRRLLEAGDYAKALARLEKTIAIDSTNPYGYYFLAKCHYRVGRYKESLSFLDVAESLLTNDPFWLAEVFALRGDNYRSLGLSQRADSSYSQALRLNRGNRAAAEGLKVQSAPR
ncbi:MAG: tetratricopeptide repeat protein [Deltaproteobacteria bacterium]|nr:tetratricopeptide repeat protein [Deltaproteobacteria bacterium]